MKFPFLLAAIPALATSVVLSACGARQDSRNAGGDTPSFLQDSERWGNVVCDTLRDLGPFESIDLSGGFADIHYEQSPTTRVVVEGNEKVRGDYAFTVEDGTFLVKNTRENIGSPHPTILVHVYAPSLRSVVVYGAGDLKLKKPVTLQGDLSISIHGAGDVDIEEIECERLDVEVHGAGDVDIRSAHCKDGSVKVYGAGDVDIDALSCTGDMVCGTHGAGDTDISHLACRNLDINLSGAGDIQAHVDCDILKATARGTGDIELSGKAKRLDKHESGLSEIHSRKLSVKDVRY